MKRALLLCAACTQQAPIACPTPLWTVPMTGTVLARAMPDGTTVVFLADYGETQQLGDMMVTAPVFAHVSSTGVVADVTPVTMVGGHAMQIAEDGAPVLADILSMARFDRTFAKVWSGNGDATSFDVAPTGAVAYNEIGDVHYLDPTGKELWKTHQLGGDPVRLTATGELFVFHGTHRLHFDVAGNQLDDVAFASVGGPLYYDRNIQRDGSVVFLVEPEESGLTRTDASGAVMWSITQPTSFNAPIVATNGDIVVITDLGTAVERFDGASGTKLAQADNCNATDRTTDLGGPPLLWAGLGSYLLLQGSDDNGRPKRALAAYAGP